MTYLTRIQQSADESKKANATYLVQKERANLNSAIAKQEAELAVLQANYNRLLGQDPLNWDAIKSNRKQVSVIVDDIELMDNLAAELFSDTTDE